MNNLVKIHNHNVFPLEEIFKGKEIVIPPQKYIEMDYDEAVQFRGHFHQIEYDKAGIQKPESYKYISIDKDDEQRIYRQRGGVAVDEKKEKFVCHVCTKEFLSKNGLLGHIKKQHLDVMVDKEARDELIDDEDIEGNET